MGLRYISILITILVITINLAMPLEVDYSWIYTEELIELNKYVQNWMNTD